MSKQYVHIVQERTTIGGKTGSWEGIRYYSSKEKAMKDFSNRVSPYAEKNKIKDTIIENGKSLYEVTKVCDTNDSDIVMSIRIANEELD